MKRADLPQGYMFDYRAGYVRSGTAIPGFDVYGPEDAEHSVISLGGCENWAKPLCEQLGGEWRVYDGCADGHTTAQAMIMLIRDGLLLKPDIIVCVSGYYDFAYQLGIDVSESDAAILKAHPFVTPRQIVYYTAITERLGIGWGIGCQKIHYGAKIDKPAYETWCKHLRDMNALCTEFGIAFAAFLQPNLYPENQRLAEYYARAEDLTAKEPYIYALTENAWAERIAAAIKETLWKG